ncbi:MAG: hypothetical protein ACQESP_10245 [Candidatus Muiribacteriota bacterium]
MNKHYLSCLFLPLSFLILTLSSFHGIYYLLLMLPAALLLKYKDSCYSIFLTTALALTLLNSGVYIFDVRFKRFLEYSPLEIFILTLLINLFIISAGYLFFKKIKEEEDRNLDELADKFNKERQAILEKENEMNHKIKDYKLDFSQKISIIRKLIENYNNDEKNLIPNELDEDIISLIKNVLKLQKFVFLKYSNEKNQYINVHEEDMFLSDIKTSKFLRWLLDRAFNFPDNINLLTKETMEKNPLFTQIIKKDKHLPEIFIPVKSGSKLSAFIIAYKDEDEENTTKKIDNEFRALATLIGEIISLVYNKTFLANNEETKPTI